MQDQHNLYCSGPRPLCTATASGVHVWRNDRCEKCGLLDPKLHQWEQCACKVCGATRHDWQESRCTRCGNPCPHSASILTWQVIASGQAVQAVKIKQCRQCGLAVSTICESPPRRKPSPDCAPTIPLETTASSAWLQDPLWQEMRNAWMALIDPQTPEQQEIRRQQFGWLETGRVHAPPGMIPEAPDRLYREALEALVQLGELDSSTAEGIRNAFAEYLFHRERSLGSCYMAILPTHSWRVDLAVQFHALSQMAGSSNLDAATVARARDSIARDLALLQQRDPFATVAECHPLIPHQRAAQVLAALAAMVPPAKDKS